MAKIQLDGVQVKFLKEMFEISDGQKAMQLCADIMIQEKLDPTHMPALVDRCIKKIKENQGKK